MIRKLPHNLRQLFAIGRKAFAERKKNTMIISTKGRYALRILIDLAEHKDEGYISLKQISERQEISLKYLEMIVSGLNKADMVRSVRGKDGGYRLTRAPEEYTLAEILRISEGSLTPVACKDCHDNACGIADRCQTLPVWQNLEKMINDYLSSVTLADLLEKDGTADSEKL